MKRNVGTHKITAEYLLKHSTDERIIEQDPRAYIKGKYVYFFKKDWDYDWDKYPDELRYNHKPPDKYRFLGYCSDAYAFKIACKGEKCRFVHREEGR